jgi:4-amino-4-deoxy-L-arabinose transferase-like glycosyltransferase
VLPKNKRFFSQYIVGVFFVIVFFLLILFGTRGVVYSDEGYILYGAQRILEGQIPYTDFHFAYTPLSLYVTAGAFLLFGETILAGRILIILLSLVTSFILFLLLKRLTNNLFITLSAVLLYVVWAPLHTNFPWPVIFSLSLSIGSLFLFFKALETKKFLYFFLSGIFTALVLLTKQNFGVVVSLNYAIAFFFTTYLKRWSAIRAFLLGWVGLLGMYTLYLIFSGSLQPFIDDFYRYTIQRVVLEQTLTTPFFYGTTFLEKSAKFFFYTAPFLMSVWACTLSYFKNRNLFFLSSFVLLFYLVGIRPTTDYIHLSPLLSLIGVPLVICWELTSKNSIKTIVGIIFVFFIILGLYSAWFRGHYRWEPPLAIQASYLSLPKTYISLDSFHKEELETLKKLVWIKTKNKESIFINAYSPLLYFVADRKNPTAFDLLESTEFYAKDEKIIVSVLEKSHTKLIIMIGQPAKTYLGEYIKKEYNKTRTINGFTMWEKR